jgi:hypothetical protein
MDEAQQPVTITLPATLLLAGASAANGARTVQSLPFLETPWVQ